MKTYLSFFVLMFAFLLSKGQAHYTYYYLAIGSANYEQDPAKFAEPDFVPFDDLPQAALSAKVMSAIFEKYMGAKGITYLTSQTSMLTKGGLTRLLDRLNSEIKKDHAAHPYILFYYCGHGISENMGWNQFFIPGTYTRLPGNKSFDELSGKLIFLGDITDYFLKRKYPYMVMADCCRKQGKDSNLPEKRLSYFFDEQALETFKIVVQGLKYLNEYHQAEPVIFSIAPGSLAPTVPLPVQKVYSLTNDPTNDVGPLCRRAVLSVQRFDLSSSKLLSIKSFVADITDAKLDKQSPPSVSFYEDTSKVASSLILLRKP